MPIDWNRKVIHIQGKGTKERIISFYKIIGDEVKEYVKELSGPNYVFEGQTKGAPKSKGQYRKFSRMLVKKLALKEEEGYQVSDAAMQSIGMTGS